MLRDGGTMGEIGSTGTKSFLYNMTTSVTHTMYLLGKVGGSGGFDSGTININSSIYSNKTGGLYSTSDERLKTIKGDLLVDLEKLSEMRKIYYTFLSDKESKVEVGTIAQDLQKIYPELVETNDNGELCVAYNRLSVIALKTVDTLYSKIKELEDLLDNE
jgi:hypothetical protein